MEVVLLRHGPAGSADFEQWPDDNDRPLTPEGRERVLRAAETLRHLEVSPTYVVCSPAARAWATATAVCEALGLSAPEAWPELLPEASAEPAATRLHDLGRGSVLVVGHEPTLVQLASTLLTGHPAGLCTQLDKAGIVGLRVRAGRRAELRFVIPKRLLGHWSDAA